MSNEGLKFNALMGLPPRQRGFCGLGNIPSTLEKSILTQDFPAAEAELRQFQNLPTHLQTIAQEIGDSDIFSLPVAQQYWLKEHNLTVLQSSAGNLMAANTCVVRPGIIVYLLNNEADVNLYTLVPDEPSPRFTPQTKRVKYNSHLLPNLFVGQLVACHWGEITIPIYKKQRELLLRTTQQALKNGI
jgi:hypothetical protein